MHTRPHQWALFCGRPCCFVASKLILFQLGHLDAFETTIPDETAMEEITEWYQTGTGYPEAVQVLTEFIKLNLIPDLNVTSVHGVACVIAKVNTRCDHCKKKEPQADFNVDTT